MGDLFRLRPFSTTCCILVLLFTGCRQSVDLGAISALGTAAQQSAGSFAALTDDFYQSCVRMKGWQRMAEPAAFPDVFTTCAEQQKASQQWETANNVVLAYVSAIAALATNSNQGDYGLSTLATTLVNTGTTPALTSAQHDAVVGAATALVNDYFSFERREALANIMPRADGDLARLITTLEQAARDNYTTQLTDERLSIRLFFEPNMSSARPGLERLYAFQFRAAERNEEAAVDSRQAAVADYVAALESIRKTHHKIADAISKNDIASISGIVKSYVIEYEPEYKALAKAFGEH